MKRITQINFNWRFSPENGVEFDSYSIEYSNRKILAIQEHSALGEGDKWYYDVCFEDGKIERIFNPNQIFYEPYEPIDLPKF